MENFNSDLTTLSTKLPKLERDYTVSLGVSGRRVVGELEANMLRAIDRTGSFSNAARSLGLSYAFLWNSISRIERLLETKVVTAERGGARGGRARLTVDGNKVLQAYAKLDSQVGRLVKGRTSSTFQLSDQGGTRPNLSVVGSHCVVVEHILNRLHEENKSMTYQIVNVGSVAGLAAMMLREADIAGIHILDEETKEYNLPFLSRYSLSNTCVLVRGYNRKQCFMVKKRNPKKIQGLEDLLRSDVKLANRNFGAGTRILLDQKLRELAESRNTDLSALTGRIRGYSMELMTHRQVAQAIVSKRADVALGLPSVAVEMELDTIPFAEEKYDFVVEKRQRNPYVRAFINTLSSPEFQKQIEDSTPGISFAPDSGKILS